MTLETKPPIEPTRIYTPEETAELLGFRGSNSRAAKNAVYEMDPRELPRTRTGANGGRVGFLGLVILRFLVNRTDEPGVELEDVMRLSRLARELKREPGPARRLPTAPRKLLESD